MVLASAVCDVTKYIFFFNAESALALNNVQIKDTEIKTGLACWPTDKNKKKGWTILAGNSLSLVGA